MDNQSTLNLAIKERQEKDKQALISTLKEMPIVLAVCKKVGISRDTYYRWRQEDKTFRRLSEDAFQQGIEFLNDMSESQIITLIKEKRMPAIALWLKNNHPRYGSKNKMYTPIAAIEDLTAEEETLLLEALSLASGGTITDDTEQHEKNNTGIPGTDQG